MYKIMKTETGFLVEYQNKVFSMTNREILDFINADLVDETNTIDNVTNIVNDRGGETILTTISKQVNSTEISSVSAVYLFTDLDSLYYGYTNDKITYPYLLVRAIISKNYDLTIYCGVPNADFMREHYLFDYQQFADGFNELGMLTTGHSGLPYNTYSSGKLCYPKVDRVKIYNDVIVDNKHVNFDVFKSYVKDLIINSIFNEDLNKNKAQLDWLIEYHKLVNSTDITKKVRLEYCDKIYKERNFIN